MPLRVQCIHCQSIINVAPNLRGKAIRCPYCQEATKIPGPAPRGRPTQLGGMPPRREGIADPRRTRMAHDFRKRTMIAPQYQQEEVYDDGYDQEPVYDDRPSRGRPAPPRDEGYDDYYDDPPVRRSKQRSGGGAGMWIVSILGVLIVAGAVGFGIWFVKFRTPAAACEPEVVARDPLHFMPADSKLVGSIDLKASGNDLYKKMVIALALSGTGNAKEAREKKELLQQTDRVFVGADLSGGTLVLQMSKEQDPSNIEKLSFVKKSRKVGDNTVYDSDQSTVYLADPKTIVIFIKMKDEQIEKILASSLPALNSPMQEQVKEVKDKPFWVVVAVEGELSKQIKKADLKKDLGDEEIQKVFAGAKFVTLVGTVDADARKLSFDLNFVCASSEDAKKVETKYQELKPMEKFGPLLEGLAGKTIFGDLKDLTVKAKDATLTVSASLSDASLRELESMIIPRKKDDGSKTPAADATQPGGKAAKLVNLQRAIMPGGLLPEKLSDETAKKLETATVLIEGTGGDGQPLEGVGFLGADPGVVFTTARVLGVRNSSCNWPSNNKVNVIINPGPKQLKLEGTVHGIDLENDLAILKVSGGGIPLQLPVELDGCGLIDAQKVFCTQMDGERKIALAESAVAALTRNELGAMSEIALGLTAEPGSPILDSRGVVVGIARAGADGRPEKIAIPAEKLRGLLHGRVTETTIGHVFLEESKKKIPVKFDCLDPLAKIGQVKLDIWTGPGGPPRLGGVRAPEKVAGETRITIPLKFETGADSFASGDVALPPLPPGHVYWMQPIVVGSGGIEQWETANTVLIDSAPLVREKVALKFNHVPPQRTVKLTGKFAYQNDGPRFADSVDIPILELLDKSADGFDIRLALGKGILQPQGGSRDPEAQNLVNGTTHAFQFKSNGTLSRAPVPNFVQAAGSVRAEAESMAGLLSRYYRFVSLPLPADAEVNPLKSWPATMYGTLESGSAKLKLNLELTCTYEGKRSTETGSEARIVLTGELETGESGTRRKARNKVAGYAWFNVNDGYFTEIKLTMRDAFKSDDKFEHRFEASLKRTPGNDSSIPVPAPVGVVKNNPPPYKPPVDKTVIKAPVILQDKELDGLWVAETKKWVYFSEQAIKIEGNKLSWVKPNGSYHGVYDDIEIILDPTKTPKQITLFKADKKEKKDKLLAIYKIEDDTLYIAASYDARPLVFSTVKAAGPGTADYMRVYKRGTVEPPPDLAKKPDPPPPPPGPNPNPDPMIPPNGPPMPPKISQTADKLGKDYIKLLTEFALSVEHFNSTKNKDQAGYLNRYQTFTAAQNAIMDRFSKLPQPDQQAYTAKYQIEIAQLRQRIQTGMTIANQNTGPQKGGR